jgi:DNA-directed RNA polymerase I subunit RPA2
MGKQTMGTPTHAVSHRTDNKLFRIQTPQVPLVQTSGQADYMMDEYPQGANAVVAVIAYTGYDMDDAMIINKAAYERGFGHGCVYKTKIIDLDEEEKQSAKDGVKFSFRFFNVKSAAKPSDDDEDGIENEAEKHYESLDWDGLPKEGDVIKAGEPLCCYVDDLSGKAHSVKHKENETAYVDTVRVISSGTGAVKAKSSLRKVSITLRYKRNPIIGDKFSSRHGQKGTLSVLWPQQDMPFTESGMTPDVMINPNAFPSRMTIGMLIESMAGKSGAIHGVFQDATPFQFHEENRLVDYLGEQLRAAGYHYYGSEPLYSGVSGTVLHADIFIGVVYYQRLRHMVSDKSQARSTGPVMAITRQPVKGRKKHGGIRLGEMERDALLSHGVAFCLHDRLMNCSDIHVAYVCEDCGGMLNVHAGSGKRGELVANIGGGKKADRFRKQYCYQCKKSSSVRAVYMPYIFRYLSNELACMGINLTLSVSS